MAVICADVMDGLASLEDESVHCCVTSPPYWGLRDYGTGTWIGGDPTCDHSASEPSRRAKSQSSSTLDGATDGCHRSHVAGDTCPRCGAQRVDNQIGLEATPEEHCERMVEVFREVRRVLRDDGTLWLNLGDSYARDFAKGGSGPNGKHDFIPSYGSARKAMRRGSARADGIVTEDSPRNRDGTFVNGSSLPLKPKDLVGIPWRVAFALQADGWWLRSDIIWSKPNSMPESVTDRPTKAHEYMFLLAKSAKYYYDADAIREPLAACTEARLQYKRTGASKWSAAETNPTDMRSTDGARANPMGRNRRTVWTISTSPYPEAHFATYPPALVEPCIKAGCPEGGTVLDPFCGSGTTGEVALKLGRDFIGIELNPEYVKLARKRVGNAAPLFAKEAE